MQYEGILYTMADGIATITINSPKQFNAFRAQTCEKMIYPFKDADFDRSIGVVEVLHKGRIAIAEVSVSVAERMLEGAPRPNPHTPVY